MAQKETVFYVGKANRWRFISSYQTCRLAGGAAVRTRLTRRPARRNSRTVPAGNSSLAAIFHTLFFTCQTMRHAGHRLSLSPWRHDLQSTPLGPVVAASGRSTSFLFSFVPKSFRKVHKQVRTLVFGSRGSFGFLKVAPPSVLIENLARNFIYCNRTNKNAFICNAIQIWVFVRRIRSFLFLPIFPNEQKAIRVQSGTVNAKPNANFVCKFHRRVSKNLRTPKKKDAVRLLKQITSSQWRTKSN